MTVATPDGKGRRDFGMAVLLWAQAFRRCGRIQKAWTVEHEAEVHRRRRQTRHYGPRHLFVAMGRAAVPLRVLYLGIVAKANRLVTGDEPFSNSQYVGAAG
jgi:hypothetical protein